MASASSDLEQSDSVNTHGTPSKKKHSEGHNKSKANLILEKSPSLIKSMREKSRSNAGTPKTESSGRSQSPIPARSPSAQKLARKDDNSDEEDEMDRNLKALDAAEAERSKTSARAAVPAPAVDSDSDDDAPVAKSFKDAKKDAMDIHQTEQEDAKTAGSKKKELRRQRTQMLQEQSKKEKKKEKKRKVQSSDDESGSQMDVDEEFELVPESVLKQAVTQTNTHILMDEDEDNLARIDRRRQRKLEREIERQDRIDSKLVTVLPLGDSTGSTMLQSRKAAAQSAESFLKDHFWGGRLERMANDHFISERVRGPALQFIVPSQPIPSTRKMSMKENRRSEMAKRRR